MKKLVTAALALAAWAGASLGAQAQGEIRIGFFPGPYADQFKRAIQPQLEKKGYTIKLTEFSNAIQPNTALLDGSLDVNVYQNKGFMDLFNNQQKADLTDLLRIPSAPVGLYSEKVKSVDAIKEGMSVSVANDPTNLGRSLMFLEKIGLIKIDAKVEPGRATERNISDNPKKLKIVPLDAPQLPRSMQDVDLSAALGNHILAAGRSLSDAIVLEDPAPQYQIILVARQGNAEKPWAKDLVAAYKSEEFKKFVSTDPKTKGFSIPDYWR